MSRLLAVVFCLIGLVADAQPADRPLAQALAAMRDGNWAGAKIAARGDGAGAVDVITWHHLRAGLGDAAEVQEFLSRNPDWPGLPYLRKKSEEAMAAASDADVLAFFADAPPQTGAGALAYARALAARGEDGAAKAEVVLAWRTLVLSSSEWQVFLDRWGEVLKPHHAARLDMALWQGWEQNARAMLTLVDDGWQKLAEARMALRALDGGVDTRIEAVPEALLNDPGLAFERFLWRVRKGRDKDAIALLLERSVSLASLGEPWAWADRRRDLAREAMREGRPEEAYKIASTHFLVEGSDYVDLEWLSGYIALQQLKNPDLARDHFQHFLAAVETPISLGRAGYWLGRAEEARGDKAAAKAAYAFGAQYQTSFYGLLAAERGGIPFNAALSGDADLPPWREAAFTQSTVFEAAILLLAAGELSLSERFLTHLAESLDPTQMAQMGDMLAELRQPHIQVMLGKRAAQFGVELPRPYYALHPMATRDLPVPSELALAIARRESEFDPSVISVAGARGLMQVMPGTAKEVAGKLGLDYQVGKLTSDPDFNVTLGTAYLAELASRFGGNAVMIAAAYNAGPSRPDRWMAEYGDPRTGAVDVIDWIEFIPFDETRNYIMRVTESLPVYRARLGLDPHPLPFSQELAGSTLLPRAPQGE
ncbi:lytic transglycosylase domain-containing protein [Mesobacterium sp. TK19101]|uniref:Lytic transglycosylase domain-containing protein n=1 Tax=Mesobacterium hydrothermale TaxID=3111907 RepID=A0ABU6HKQ4_9RHOB|nr:lytic transglycosylase domain-containing protein [Mesobacterium sp. TK19101]MEC3862876.1 lytic transglycosylase domain-containing protein [Mesobacterium sp. TK19101]